MDKLIARATRLERAMSKGSHNADRQPQCDCLDMVTLAWRDFGMARLWHSDLA